MYIPSPALKAVASLCDKEPAMSTVGILLESDHVTVSGGSNLIQMRVDMQETGASYVPRFLAYKADPIRTLVRARTVTTINDYGDLSLVTGPNELSFPDIGDDNLDYRTKPGYQALWKPVAQTHPRSFDPRLLKKALGAMDAIGIGKADVSELATKGLLSGRSRMRVTAKGSRQVDIYDMDVTIIVAPRT